MLSLLESNIANIFVMANKYCARSRLTIKEKTLRFKGFLSTKSFQLLMWSILLKFKGKIFRGCRWHKDMKKDIFGQDFCIGIMKKIVRRDAFCPLLQKNIKHQKLKVRFLCITYKSPKNKVHYCHQNISQEDKITYQLKIIVSSVIWFSRSILSILQIWKMDFLCNLWVMGFMS